MSSSLVLDVSSLLLYSTGTTLHKQVNKERGGGYQGMRWWLPGSVRGLVRVNQFYGVLVRKIVRFLRNVMAVARKREGLVICYKRIGKNRPIFWGFSKKGKSLGMIRKK